VKEKLGFLYARNKLSLYDRATQTKEKKKITYNLLSKFFGEFVKMPLQNVKFVKMPSRN
jgi:hypothetical protein